MGVLSKAKEAAKRLLGRSEPDGTTGGKVVRRVARLPTRLFADGSFTRGVAADGLYGLARLTVHEAQLDLFSLRRANDAAETDAGGAAAAAVQPPTNTKKSSKYYVVVSVGRQTFASKRLRRSPAASAAAGGSSRSAASGDAASGAGDATSSGGAGAAQGGESAARFQWEEGTDVVLQRGGATVAQLALYKAGAIDGALGDKLQCWCTLDLATYFGEAAAEAPAEHQPAKPPTLLMTHMADSSGHTLSASGDADTEPATAAVAAEEAAAREAAAEAAVAAAGEQDAQQEGQQEEGQQAPPKASLSQRTLGPLHGGDVLQDVWLPLVDPGDPALVRGRLRLSVRAASVEGMERQLWRRLLPLADLDGTGRLTHDQFASLMQAMGSRLAPEEVEALFTQAGPSGDGTVDVDGLAAALTACHGDGEFDRLVTRCPVDGAELLPNDDMANVMYVTLALDEGSGESLRGGYTTPEEVSRSWLLSMTEWATQPLAGAPKALWRGNAYRAGGLRSGAAAAHILVFDRKTKRVVEEAVSPALTLAMRAMYQSRAGRLLLREGGYKQLRKMSERHGAYASSPESAADIPKFLAAFRGQVDMQEALDPDPDAYQCFNDFFVRKLKPEARPIAAPGNPGVIASAADCRLTVFASVDDATRCWVKGHRFSLAGLLADRTACAPAAALAAGPAASKASSAEELRPEASAASKASKASLASLGESSEAGGNGGDGSEAGGRVAGGTDGLAAQFEGGSMAIFRLAPQDYHRFHLPVGGRVEAIVDVPGELMTVNPIAVNSKYANVFTRNQRSVLLLRSPEFGLVAYVAVGATVVGTIVWTAEVGQELPKGAECGYFAFGGSTIVLLFQRGAAAWDADLLQNSLKSLETRVLMGEQLGVRGPGAAALQPAASEPSSA